MKLTKKMTAILLALVMCFSLLCMAASAEDPKPDEKSLDLEKLKAEVVMEELYPGLVKRQTVISFPYAVKYEVSSIRAAAIMNNIGDQLLAEAVLKLTLDTEMKALYGLAVSHDYEVYDPETKTFVLPVEGGDYLARHVLSFTPTYGSFDFSRLLNEGIVIVQVNALVSYRSTAEQEAAVDEAVDEAVEKIIDDFNFGVETTGYQKVEAIYEWMYGTDESPNIGFDNMGIAFYETTPEASSAYAALINKSTTSEGFAVVFYRLCREFGIDCRIVSAETDNLPHVWNIVKLDGNWYYIDSSRGEGNVEMLLPKDLHPVHPDRVFFLRGTQYWSNIPVFTAGDQYLNPVLYPGFAGKYKVSSQSYCALYEGNVHQCHDDLTTDLLYHPEKVGKDLTVIREAYYECCECGQCFRDKECQVPMETPADEGDDSGEGAGGFNVSFLDSFKNLFDSFFKMVAQFFRSFFVFC